MSRLFLQGGALRGLFTAGVLDAFLDEKISFDEIYGISAGSLCAIPYKSKDRGWIFKATVMFAKDPRMISLSNFFKEGSVFNWDYLMHTIPQDYLPLNHEEYLRNPARLFAGTYACLSGETEYYEITDYQNPMCRKYLQASCTLPMLAQVCELNGKPYADGGVADSLALQAYRDDGTPSVFVLTREYSYRMKEHKPSASLRTLYREYPLLVKDYENRGEGFNRDMAVLRRLEAEKKAIVIRPSYPVDVTHTERNLDKLEKLYRNGYRMAEEKAEQLRQYLGVAG